jgi:hypothetical protein
MLIKSKMKSLWSFGVLLCLLVPQHLFAQVNPNAGVEAKVRASFPDMPAMIAIAKCESGFRQFGADGAPLRGGSTKRYIGIFQIDEKTHTTKASSLAYDINTVDGNIAYARHMYFASGTNPWKGCLSLSPGTSTQTPVMKPTTTATAPGPAPQPIPASPSNATVSGSLTANLNVGMNHSQVMILQQILNKSGFAIAASGPGSPGNETSYFGALTKEAVRKFQCAKGIACDGSESSTGFGRVGPMTRTALNSVK